MRSTRSWVAIAATSLVVGAVGLSAGADAPSDLSGLELSGDWYVLVHYRDERSEDKTITKFKDFAWSVRQDEKQLTWESFPYVVFNEDLEEVRRHAMQEHLPWEPDAGLWKRIRESIDVSSRAAAKKTLRGTREQGYESLAALGGGLNTLSFSRDWKVSFEPEKVRIVIVDSLSGSAGLEPMEGSTVYEITEKVAPGELAGRYTESKRHGTFRMVKSRRRRIVR